MAVQCPEFSPGPCLPCPTLNTSSCAVLDLIMSLQTMLRGATCFQGSGTVSKVLLGMDKLTLTRLNEGQLVGPHAQHSQSSTGVHQMQVKQSALSLTFEVRSQHAPHTLADLF